MSRKLIEQMLDCIEELKYSNDTFTSQFKSNAAITAAREYLAQVQVINDPAEIRRVFEIDEADYPPPDSGFAKL